MGCSVVLDNCRNSQSQMEFVKKKNKPARVCSLWPLTILQDSQRQKFILALNLTRRYKTYQLSANGRHQRAEDSQIANVCARIPCKNAEMLFFCIAFAVEYMTLRRLEICISVLVL